MQATTMTNNTGAPVFYDNGDHHPQHGTLFGFWIYLMSDCLIFAVLFATYAVLGRSYAAGPSGADLFDLPLVALEHRLPAAVVHHLWLCHDQDAGQQEDRHAGLAGDHRCAGPVLPGRGTL